MVLPVLLVAVDLGSDTNVLVTMGTYFVSTGTAADNSNDTTAALNTTAGAGGNTRAGRAQVYMLMVISVVILLLSTLKLLASNPLPSLLRGAHTAVAMGSREEEEQDVPLPLGE